LGAAVAMQALMQRLGAPA